MKKKLQQKADQPINTSTEKTDAVSKVSVHEGIKAAR